MPEEQGSTSQDPVQQTPAAEAAAQPEPTPQYTSSGPWADDIRSSFTDPEVQAQVDAFLRAKIQPHVTQVEQQAAEARQLYDAFQADPYAAYAAVGEQLYGEQYQPPQAAAPTPQQPQYFQDQYGNVVQPIGYDAQGNPVFGAAQPPAQQPPAQQPPAQQATPETDPRLQAVLEDYDERLYDQAKQQFLSDPANADIHPALFDQFVANAETWDEAAAAYRAYAAAWAAAQDAPPPDTAPPQLGDQGQGSPSTQPVEQRKSLNETIDEIFNEQAAAPPM